MEQCIDSFTDDRLLIGSRSRLDCEREDVETDDDREGGTAVLKVIFGFCASAQATKLVNECIYNINSSNESCTVTLHAASYVQAAEVAHIA
jgi:hypothetical protein